MLLNGLIALTLLASSAPARADDTAASLVESVQALVGAPTGTPDPRPTIPPPAPTGVVPPPVVTRQPKPGVGPALLNGAFVQYQNWMMDLDKRYFTQDLDAMQKAKINTVFLQWTQYNGSRFFTVNYDGYDPTETILEYADQIGMKIFVGVRFDDEWWSKWYKDEWLQSTADSDVRFAQVLFKRYGKHKSFAGWYIPYEVSDGDFDDSQIQSLNTFFRKLAVGFKNVSGWKYPVAVSTFFKGALPAPTVEKIMDKLFCGTSIDILMPQDGVGANVWFGSVAVKSAPWMDAFLRTGKHLGMHVWPVIEVFTTQTSEPQKAEIRVPAPIAQIEEQLSVREPGMEQFIAFDFFHYMSPFRGTPQQQLYDDYLKVCVENPGGCPDPQ